MRPSCPTAAAVLLVPMLASLSGWAQQTSIASPTLTQQKPGGMPIYQTNPPFPTLPNRAQHEANFETETQQANALFAAGRQLDSLPLYADLSRQDPTVPLFAERHAAALMAKYSTPGVEQKEQFNALIQAYNEMRRAQSLGDNSPQLRGMLTVAEKTPIGAILTGIPLTVGYTYGGKPEVGAAMRQADAAFAAQKFDDAAKIWASAAAQDPAFYTAALYAGDAYFRGKGYANAGIWFAKAIAIDPDRETAYRYGGDALYHAGDPAGARAQYVKAFVAEPYSVATWEALREWAGATKTQLTVPRVVRPQFYMLDGKVDFDPKAIPETGDGHASWLVYQQVRVAHGAPTLVQNVAPAGGTMANGDLKPSGYLHTLGEETEALNALLSDIDKKLADGTVTKEKLEPGIDILLQMRKDNMLECFVLLNASDMGLRHDYAKFRATHRDLLAAYVDRYILNQP